MIVIQRRFSDVRVKDTEISPTIEMDGGGGGGNLPMVLQIYERADSFGIKSESCNDNE